MFFFSGIKICLFSEIQRGKLTSVMVNLFVGRYKMLNEDEVN